MTYIISLWCARDTAKHNNPQCKEQKTGCNNASFCVFNMNSYLYSSLLSVAATSPSPCCSAVGYDTFGTLDKRCTLMTQNVIILKKHVMQISEERHVKSNFGVQYDVNDRTLELFQSFEKSNE